MASFLPRYRKKHETLNRREAELKRSLIECAAETAVRELAEEVATARVRALKEELAKLPPCEGPNAARFHRLEKQIRQARQVTAGEILMEFRNDLMGGRHQLSPDGIREGT
jgi:hypothetical protein